MRETVDCERLAAEGASLERVYALAELPRVQDLLADRAGNLQARFVFAKSASGRAGASVEVEAVAQLVCQRCLSGFPCTIAARSEIEFASAAAAAEDPQASELYVLEDGLASLAEIAEEEFLLAVPLAPACSAPERCGRAPRGEAGEAAGTEVTRERVRPFDALRELMTKNDRT
ncbi:MAG: DUF177 domain-containing protein [Betaproteobacteria bacterium]|nr:DUF177 domain-containing protein [Betaproteobacteria bacterium]